jgi:hypothetical protein
MAKHKPKRGRPPAPAGSPGFTVVSVRVPTDHLDLMRELAAEDERPVSKLIAMAVAAYLRSHGKLPPK